MLYSITWLNKAEEKSTPLCYYDKTVSVAVTVFHHCQYPILSPESLLLMRKKVPHSAVLLLANSAVPWTLTMCHWCLMLCYSSTTLLQALLCSSFIAVLRFSYRYHAILATEFWSFVTAADHLQLFMLLCNPASTAMLLIHSWFATVICHWCLRLCYSCDSTDAVAALLFSDTAVLLF